MWSKTLRVTPLKNLDSCILFAIEYQSLSLSISLIRVSAFTAAVLLSLPGSAPCPLGCCSDSSSILRISKGPPAVLASPITFPCIRESHSPPRFSAKCSFFGQSLSRGHYQPTCHPPEGVYLLNIFPVLGMLSLSRLCSLSLRVLLLFIFHTSYLLRPPSCIGLSNYFPLYKRITLPATLLGQMFIFRTISQPRTLTADMPPA